MLIRCAAVVVISSLLVESAEIKGKVSSVVRGEPLARVQVSLVETGASTTSSSDGSFSIRGLTAGKYTIKVNAVGYRLATATASLSSQDETREFDITLVPDNFRRTDTVEVRGDVFQGADSVSVNEINLTSSEIRESSTVFADDPFRAIQAMPGVSASGNNELFAEFSVLGAPFKNVGVYLDDVLIPGPFHNLRNVENGASVSLLTSETVDEIKLLPVAYPEKYGDDIGAVLDLRTRDGSRTPPLFRLAIGMADTDLLGEGQLGHAKRGSWLASARKSYLGYLVRNRIGDHFSDISFYDGDFKLSYDLTPGQNLNLYTLAGHTNVDVRSSVQTLDANSFKKGTGDFIFSRLGWRWAISPRLLLDNRGAYIRQPFVQRNAFGDTLTNAAYSEWVAGSDVRWSWSNNAVLAGGWTLRRLQDYSASYFNPGQSTAMSFVLTGTALRTSGYLQQAGTLLSGRLHLFGSIRVDAQQGFDAHPFSPQFSTAFQLRRSTQLQFGIGHYDQLQFTASASAGQGCFAEAELLEHSNHYTASLEQRFADTFRVRLQGFARRSAELFGRHVPGSCGGPHLETRLSPFQRNYERGVQVVLQRRTANGLSGWLGYTLTYARQSLRVANPSSGMQLFTEYFPSGQDQRHSVNGFGTYRWFPTVNLSAKILYGSGFPAGFAAATGPGNEITLIPVPGLGTYFRADIRVDKCWAFSRWKLTSYGEVLNVTDHDNRFLTGTLVVNGQFLLESQRSLPITPTAGLVFEF